MRETGIDISEHRPKAIEGAIGPDLRLVIGLCEEEACPVIAGVRSLHWPLPNPAGGPIEAYREMRDELARRIRALIDALPKEA